MRVLYYTAIIIFSGVLALLVAEYQKCYRDGTVFSVSNIKNNLLKTPRPFIAFFAVYIAFSIAAIIFSEKKGLTEPQLLQYIILWECMLAGAWIDLRVKRIPNKIFLVLLAVRCAGIMAEIAMYPDHLLEIIIMSLSGMFLGGIIMLIFRLISRGGLGAGDIKLFAVIGFYFGIIPTMNIMFYTIFLSAIAAGFLLITRKAGMKSTLALGPFAFVGINIYYILL